MCKQEKKGNFAKDLASDEQQGNNRGRVVRFGTRLLGSGKVMPMPLGVVGAV